MEVKENIDVHSEEMQDLLGEIPNWTIRWGITVVLTFLIIILFLSWFIRYPDLIEGRAVLTTQNPPIKLFSNSSGKVKKIFVSDTSIVNKGGFIAEIESQTSYKDVFFLNSLIDEVDIFLEDSTKKIDVKNKIVLGEIQEEYNKLVNGINDYKELRKRDNYYLKSINNLNIQIKNQKSLQTINFNQSKLLNNQIIGAKDRFNVNKRLFDKGVISKMDLIKEKEIYSQKVNELELSKKQKVQTEISISNYKKELDDFSFQFNELKRRTKSAIKQSLGNIKNFIDRWEQVYIISSPLDGKVSFLIDLKENQFVNSGAALFAVIPNDSDYKVTVNIPSNGFGKIRVGQKVRLKLDNFQYEDYGYLIGSINKLSVLPVNNFYRVEVRLDKGLITNFNKKINYTPEMTGTAEIITEDLRLFQRFIKNFRQLFDRN